MSQSLPLYGRVKFVTDRHAGDGAPRGSVGYIIEIYDDGAYEVEISNAQGITIAQLVAEGEDLELAEGTS